MSLTDALTADRLRVGGVSLLVLAGLGAILSVGFGVDLARLITPGFVTRTLEMATPIALAAVGGLYAEKSGVFNIGLEGFMIVGAFTTAGTMFALGGTSPTQAHVWAAVVTGVVVAVALTTVFAVLLIRYKADQIVAGLAVWFIGLGFAPFAAALIWGSRSSPGLESVDRIAFGLSPLVFLAALLVSAAWVVLYRTRYGYWVQAAGENPEALDTAGVNVNRVRYATVIFSGAMAGLGGAVLLAHAGNFVGTGSTMVDGRGWIAIVAYLFGNYNPVGAAAAALLFGALDMLNVQFQTVGVDVPARLVNLLPYVAVLVVLTAYGKTRIPSVVGEPYETEE
ncbi:ABC transporter permease [Halorubrum pallidum]|uniref:ABC transporter permease n=1 Tax=Halorubrum pallidum TaxID=1526114 RepID=A0ABD5T309_9EURY